MKPIDLSKARWVEGTTYYYLVEDGLSEGDCIATVLRAGPVIVWEGRGMDDIQIGHCSNPDDGMLLARVWWEDHLRGSK